MLTSQGFQGRNGFYLSDRCNTVDLTFCVESLANALWSITDEIQKKENSFFSFGPAFVKS